MFGNTHKTTMANKTLKKKPKKGNGHINPWNKQWKW
jgi:hypothetical protein